MPPWSPGRRPGQVRHLPATVGTEGRLSQGPADGGARREFNPDDPIKARLRAFIAGDGLATTPARPGQGARLTASWNNKVIYAPDPTHGGNPIPGLMGKLWVFGPDEAVPLSMDGEIFVGAWDNSQTANGGEPVLLEVWHINPEAVKKIRRRDFIGGEAYNLFLPWTQYHVDLKQINVVARFNGADRRSWWPPGIMTWTTPAVQRAQERPGLANRLRPRRGGGGRGRHHFHQFPGGALSKSIGG